MVFAAYIFISHVVILNTRDVFLPIFVRHQFAFHFLNFIFFYSWYKVYIFLILFFSLFLLLGLYRNIAALMCWIFMLPLTIANEYIINPGTGLTGFLLIMLAFLPKGEKWSVDFIFLKCRSEFKIPDQIFYLTNFLLFLIYLNSGASKLFSPTWLNGTNIRYFISIFSSDFAHDFLSTISLKTCGGIAKTILVVYFFTFFYIFRSIRIRFILNLTLMFFHFFLFVFFQIKEVSAAMVLIHLLLLRMDKTNKPAFILFSLNHNYNDQIDS